MRGRARFSVAGKQRGPRISRGGVTEKGLVGSHVQRLSLQRSLDFAGAGKIFQQQIMFSLARPAGGLFFFGLGEMPGDSGFILEPQGSLGTW